MIVFDLICQNGAHQFEGWFGSSDDYESQKKAGLLSCPTCGSVAIGKAVMAPNVGAKSNQRPAAASNGAVQPEAIEPNKPDAPISNAVQIPAEYQELVGKLAKAQSEMLEKSEWVGEEFSEKAREIHYGEADEKSIHGTATADDVAALEEEGIDIAPLPLPVTPPESQN